jgi:hypothetical protein
MVHGLKLFILGKVLNKADINGSTKNNCRTKPSKLILYATKGRLSDETAPTESAKNISNAQTKN